MEIARGKRQIRMALSEAGALNKKIRGTPEGVIALNSVRRYQCGRFEATYHDLLGTSTYGPACRFFLDELYSLSDFSQRDSEFSRIAGVIERLFPSSVVEVAVSLAELHALTEDFDSAMATYLLNELSAESIPLCLEPKTYRSIWKRLGRTRERMAQLDAVLGLGRSLEKVISLPGIRLSLRAMRGPASVAQLSTLQKFLERGFDTFAGMANTKGAVSYLLNTIEQRETLWISQMED